MGMQIYQLNHSGAYAIIDCETEDVSLIIYEKDVDTDCSQLSIYDKWGNIDLFQNDEDIIEELTSIAINDYDWDPYDVEVISIGEVDKEYDNDIDFIYSILKELGIK